MNIKWLLVFGLFLVSCSTAKDVSAQKELDKLEEVHTDIKPIKEHNEDYLSVITIQLGQPVVLDNPRAYIEISILLNHYKNLWMEEVEKEVKPTNEEDVDKAINDFLAKKEKWFYKQLGLTVEDYNEYANAHITEVLNYLDSNLELNEALLDSVGSHIHGYGDEETITDPEEVHKLMNSDEYAETEME